MYAPHILLNMPIQGGILPIGKNVFSHPLSWAKMCGNIEGYVFRCTLSMGVHLFISHERTKTMKKILCLISVFMLIVVLAFSLSSCECKHELQEATCTTPRTCAKCGETFGTTIPHKYERVACGEYMRCKDCGANSNYSISEHLYLGNCGEIGTCYYCDEQSPEILEHTYKGNVHTGVLKCNKCDRQMCAEDIQGKSTKDLTGAERAYIYWHLNHYLTALSSSGKYLYTENEAFQMTATKFNLSVLYLKNDFWGGGDFIDNHDFYAQYYYK